MLKKLKKRLALKRAKKTPRQIKMKKVKLRCMI